MHAAVFVDCIRRAKEEELHLQNYSILLQV